MAKRGVNDDEDDARRMELPSAETRVPLRAMLGARDWSPERIWLLAWRLRLIPARTDGGTATDLDVVTALVALLEHVERQER